VIEADEDSSIKKQGFSFIGLKGIQDIVQSQAVDVVGVVVEVGVVGNVPLKSGQTKQRKNIQLGDESGLKIQVALWGNLASMFDLQVGQVLAIKNAKVSDYGGKSLNSGDDSSQIYIEPDH
jgi:replication factor A1